MSRIYTTKTPSLKATIADVRNLDAKKLTLNGKNILDYISESGFDSYDTRDPQLKNDELDIWNTEISLSNNGYIEVKPFEHSYYSISSTQSTTIKSAVKVIDNEVLGANDEHLMYWQTDGLMDSSNMFYKSGIESFTSDLSGLTKGYNMFHFCENLTTFSSDLSSLINSSYMFSGCSALTSFNTDSSGSPVNLSSLTDGQGMFHNCSNLESFPFDLPSLTNGVGMFDSCSNLKSFTTDLSSLTSGYNMFYRCSNLKSFTSDLPSLTNGGNMFYYCENLESFSSDLSSLTSGYAMFNYSNLASFKSDLSSLTSGNYMFSNCPLVSFNSDLSSLANGDYMFYYCNHLTSFSANLSSLRTGQLMFYHCKLDAKSVANIVHALPTHNSNGTITIGIGCDNTEADQLLFAQECDCETWQELLDEFSAKNWDVDFQCNGRPTEATTYNMRRGETLPVYTKLEEVIMPTDENERKPHYTYTSTDGSKFFNINYFHSTNGSTEGYDVFSSLEEAISTYNVTPKN